LIISSLVDGSVLVIHDVDHSDVLITGATIFKSGGRVRCNIKVLMYKKNSKWIALSNFEVSRYRHASVSIQAKGGNIQHLL
jgi:hypothetical protein